MVNFELLKSGLRYLSEIFTICLSYVCANLMKKYLPLLNRPARNGPFLPKFWTALATVIVGIFFPKKILVSFYTNISCLWEGILNILKKTAFSNFSKAFISRFSEFLVLTNAILLNQGNQLLLMKINKIFSQKMTSFTNLSKMKLKTLQ